MLERMDTFFANRLDGYDEHMMTAIEAAEEFYPFTAQQLPMVVGAHVLDLGCGTGLELEYYLRMNDCARITGIDMTAPMLRALEAKFPGKELTLICGSYFEEPLGQAAFDAAVSVESLHHFTQAEKLPLYRRLHDALRPGGYFILTDYFAPTEDAERQYRADYLRLKAEQGLDDATFYHYDTPLTVAHETQALLAAGFTRVTQLGQWGATCTLRADW